MEALVWLAAGGWSSVQLSLPMGWCPMGLGSLPACMGLTPKRQPPTNLANCHRGWGVFHRASLFSPY